MKNLDKARIKRVSGQISDQGVDCLVKYASKVPQYGIIVDIGTGRGKSSFTLTYGSYNSVSVYTIDIYINRHFLDIRKRFGWEYRLHHLLGDSKHLGAKHWKKEIDLLFIDGDHSYEAVKADTKLWGKHVKPNGYILYHDYSHANAGVRRLVDQQEGEMFEKVELDRIIYVGKKL